MTNQQTLTRRTYPREPEVANKNPSVTFEDILVEIRARQKASRMF